MQQSQGSRRLLTALDVQQLLHVDRSTVYRMAEDGRLPALRVGRSWRFPADRIAALLQASVTPAPMPDRATAPRSGPAWPEPAADLASVTPLVPGSTPADAELNVAAASAVVEVAAGLLGVMMLVTDMAGHPVTDVANPCAWFTEHSSDPDVLERCVAEWRDLAGLPDLTPRFAEGANGFECARAFVRSGTSLVGMVLAGGVSPSLDAQADPDLYHLDPAQRDYVLGALPRIAAAISNASSNATAAGTTTPWRPTPDAPSKEN